MHDSSLNNSIWIQNLFQCPAAANQLQSRDLNTWPTANQSWARDLNTWPAENQSRAGDVYTRACCESVKITNLNRLIQRRVFEWKKKQNQNNKQIQCLSHKEKSFRNLVKSNRNQIVFTIFRLIWNQTDVRLLFQINRKMVNTIWYRFHLIRFRKKFSVCSS